MKRQGLPENTVVFIQRSKDQYLFRTALRRGLFNNKVPHSGIYDIKFELHDNNFDYETLLPF